jgi:hypothetical protein
VRLKVSFVYKEVMMKERKKGLTMKRSWEMVARRTQRRKVGGWGIRILITDGVLCYLEEDERVEKVL